MYYWVGFAWVSVLFIANCIVRWWLLDQPGVDLGWQGFVIVGSNLNILNDKLGFGNLPGIDNGWNLDDALDYHSWACSAFGIHASAPPFPLFRIAYAINGFDASLEDPQANELVVSYQDNAVTNMGILHAAYSKVIVILHHRLGPNRCWIALGMKWPPVSRESGWALTQDLYGI